MANLAALRTLMPAVNDVHMQADGYCLWLAWQGESNPVLVQTLEDYGGVKTAEEGGQAAWFFFSPDVFLAAARLGVWGRFNSLPVTMQIFPVRINVGMGGEKFLLFDESLWLQDVRAEASFQVWVHPACRIAAQGLPGISALAKAPPQGMSGVDWWQMEVDARLPYRSSMGWYVVLHPVGNPIDKVFQFGWREFFNHIEAILQRNKLRFTLHNYFLMFPLDGLRQCKSWTRDFLSLIARLKEEHPEHYWPCVLVTVDRKGLNLNDDLPTKLSVDWEQLSPDYPHMTMRNALVLGEEFLFHEVRFAPARQAPDDWCSVTLRREDAAQGGVLPQMVPAQLVVGSNPHCFYCGQRSHLTPQCPTRTMPPRESTLWRQVALLDFSVMRDAMTRIDARLLSGEEDPISGLIAESTPEGLLTRGFYDLLWPVQVRSISTFWRLRSKDMRKGLDDLAPEDNSPVWETLRTFPHRELHEVDRELQTLAHRFPKDFRVMSLRGFVALEQGDITKALAYWKEAEMFSTFPVIQAWHVFLQARAMEFQNNFSQALLLYDQVLKISPSLSIVEHRKLVCEVKRGFTGQALGTLVELVGQDGHTFNKVLIDPEMERGHIQIFSRLYGLWTEMEARAKEEEKNLIKIRDELAVWFLPGNIFVDSMAERIDKLQGITSIHNYVAFQSLSTGRAQLEKELQMYIAKQAREFKDQFKSFTEELRAIHDESAWFPFPGALVEFNKSCSQSVVNMNWALRTNFHVPEAFRKAQMMVDQEAERMKRLKGRMRFLRIIRDSTLFVLSFAESFFWIELSGILLIFVLLPLVLVYGDRIGLDMAANLLTKERWQVQKVFLLMLTVFAVGAAALRTVLRFEAIRDKVFAKARAASKRPPSKK